MHDFFGLTVSRAGLLGHLRWGGALFEPVVEELLERVAALKDEIARLEAAVTAKKASRTSADQFFKR